MRKLFWTIAFLCLSTSAFAQAAIRGTTVTVGALNVSACKESSGTGTPNGSVTGSPCDLYYQTTGDVWLKATGSATTSGWIALSFHYTHLPVVGSPTTYTVDSGGYPDGIIDCGTQPSPGGNTHTLNLPQLSTVTIGRILIITTNSFGNSTCQVHAFSGDKIHGITGTDILLSNGTSVMLGVLNGSWGILFEGASGNLGSIVVAASQSAWVNNPLAYTIADATIADSKLGSYDTSLTAGSLIGQASGTAPQIERQILLGTGLSMTTSASCGSGLCGTLNVTTTTGSLDGVCSINGDTLLRTSGTWGCQLYGGFGNNTPSLTSPANAPVSINQAYTGAIGSNRDDGQTLNITWTPSGTVTGSVLEGLYIQGSFLGTQVSSEDIYGLHINIGTQSSGTVSKIEAIRAEAAGTVTTGTLSSAYGVGSVVFADHHTITSAIDYFAYPVQVGTSGVITNGVEFYGADPAGSGCTATCVSERLEWGTQGALTFGPVAGMFGAYGYQSNAVLSSHVLSTDLQTSSAFQFFNIADQQYTAAGNVTVNGFIQGLSQNLNIDPAGHTITQASINGGNFEVETIGAGTITDKSLANLQPALLGLNVELDLYAGGGSITVDTAIGLELIFGHGDSGTVTNGRQIWVTTPYDTSAPVTNFDGIRIDDQTYAGSTTNFAIKYNAPHGIAGIGANGSTKIANITFSQLPSAHDIGDLFLVTDSSVTTWGSTVASGGSNKVLVMWNGTNWTVIGK